MAGMWGIGSLTRGVQPRGPRWMGLALALCAILPAEGQIAISEFMAANVSTRVDAYSGELSDWIELHNAGAREVDLQGYTLTDDLGDPGRWPIPSCRLPAGGYRLIWADGLDLPASDGPALPTADLAIVAPAAGPGWRIVGSTDTGLHDAFQGRPALSIASVLSTVQLVPPDPVDLAGYESLSFYFHPGEAKSAILPASFLLLLNNNWDGAVQLLGDETAGTPLDLNLQQWQQVEIPLKAFQVEGPLTRITLGGSLKGGLYLSSLRLTPAPPLYHTNFKLNQAGEELGLFDAAGALVDSVSFGPQLADVSFGRPPEGASPWVHFALPTPGGANGQDGLAAADPCPPPEFSLPGGPYQGRQTLALSHPDPGVEIRYSVDGSRPTPASPLYTAPLPLDVTTALTARAFLSGRLPSAVVTQTLLIDPAHSLPVVAITTDPDYLWDDEIGIYVVGTNGIIADDSVIPMNSNQPWERPAHIEYYPVDGTPGFSQQIGLSIHGAFSRHFTQKSLSIMARDKFGLDEIPYPLFADRPTQAYHSFILRNGGNDWLTNLLDDALMQAMVMGRMDVDLQAYQPVVVYLNGQYWGIHNALEKLNRYYLENNHGIDPDQVDIVEGNGILKAGDLEQFDAMMDFMDQQHLDDPEAYARATELIDVEAYANLQIALIYAAPADNFFKNVKGWRPRTDAGRWRWFLYDTDNGYNRSDRSAFGMATDPNAFESRLFGDIAWGTLILRRLLENPGFRADFIQRFAAHINSTFAPERVLPILDSLAAGIEPEMPAHIARWRSDCMEHEWWGTFCGISSMSSWRSEVSRLRTFAAGRPANLRKHLRDHFGLSTMTELRVEVAAAGTGQVLVNGVAHADSGLYFTQIPLRLQAVPAAGYRFAGWGGAARGDSPTAELVLQDTTRVTAHFARAEIEPQRAQLRINEIAAFNDSTLADEFGEYEDWVEIYNAGAEPMDLGGLYVTDRHDLPQKWQIPTTAPDSTTILPGDFLVLWADEDTDQGILHVDFKLSRDGEQIGLVQLQDGQPVFVDSFTFGPQAADSTWGRYPDGSAAVRALAPPTPGRPNEGGLTAVDEGSAQPALPRQFGLWQNYPNPFNPRTTITYELPEACQVRLQIYSVTGQRVASLVEAWRPAGVHEVAWDSRGVAASGVYFYRLEAGGFGATRRMLLLE